MTDPVQRPLTDEEQEQAREPIREAFDEVRAWLAGGNDSVEYPDDRGEE